MNVNVKISMTDEQRNVMFRRLTGKNGKGMVSRADVNLWVKEQLERFLANGSAEIVEESNEPISINIEDVDVGEVITQNQLLQSRVNRLQFLLDTNSRGNR
jgi:hypothetical protein